MEIKGDKITLRPVSMEFAEEMFEFTRDPGALKYTDFPFPKTLDDEKAWIKMILEGNSEKIFCIFVSGQDNPIGSLGHKMVENENKVFDLGILLGVPEYRGKGYGSDAMRTLIKYLFNEKEAEKLTLNVLIDNEVAIKTYKKCGFKIVRQGQEKSVRDGRIIDVYYMEILKENFYGEA